VPAKHYRVTLDYRRYVPLLPPRDQPGYRKTLDIDAIGKAERVPPPPRAQVVDGRGI
jgi:hypothetical protein